LGDLVSGNAAYSPDGLRIAFHIKKELWVANADGTGRRRLVLFNSSADAPAWLPGGARIRFTLAPDGKTPSSIWEIDADGSGLRQILPGWGKAGICCGVWTADGRNFVFVEVETHRLWALPERRKWWRRASAGPFPLPSLPTWAWSPLTARDGKHIFFWGGGASRADLQLLDLRTQALSPFLPGHWVGMPGFSRGRDQVAYVEHDRLWRSRANGEDVQLIALPGLQPFFPRWSPDGRTLVFIGNDQTGAHNVYTIASDGGVAEPLLPGTGNLSDPDWSPDGSQIVVDHDYPGGRADCQMTDIPGSENLILPRWSPNGRFLAATSEDTREIRLYDFALRTWRVAARGASLSYAGWSMDGARLFFQDKRAAGIPLYAFDLRSGATKTVAHLDGLLSSLGGGVVALARGDVPVIEVRRTNSDLYAAEIEFP
jgi:Tol biopolymer transport system component